MEKNTKIKKKRKVSDTNAETPVKKKKSKNHVSTENDVNNEVLQKLESINHENSENNGKTKKKNKRKISEVEEIPAIDAAPTINGDAASATEKILDGAAIRFTVESKTPEASACVSVGDGDAKKRDKKKKKKLNGDAGNVNEITQNGAAFRSAAESEIPEASANISVGDGNTKKREKKKKRKLNGDAGPDNEITQNRDNGKDDAEINGETEEREDAKVSAKEANKLTGKSLRKSFNAQGGISALSKFLTICKNNADKDLAADYLQAGGSLLEILRLLDSSDKKNINNAHTVFAAMHLIIMKILAEYPQYQSRAEEACRHFINSHLSFVHSMLSSQSFPKHRKTVLRLLASMVSLGGSLPRELLGHLTFHSQVLDTLSQHTMPTDPQSVRTCFIHFVLAFLVEGDTPVIRALLDKRGMLTCIFAGLVYDSHTTVHLVLDSVKSYVLENPLITKTSKLHVFSTPVLQSLVTLYNWKGPKNWPNPKEKKRDPANDIVNPDEKEIAVEAVHNILITLLTSYRQGVIFHDRTLGTSGMKNNQLVNTILQSLDRPWEHPRPADLVIKILVACPDLIRSQLIYTEPFLEPRASKKWISVMRFVGKLVESLDPISCLKPCLSELSPSQLISAVTTLTIPLVVLKNAILPSMSDLHTIIRQEAVVLLTAMLKQAKSFVTVVQNNCYDSTDFVAFRHAITDYIAKNVPGLETILKVWSLGLEKGKEDVEPVEIAEFIPRKHDHFAAILDLLEAYQTICPERFDLGAATNAELQPSILLTVLNDIEEIEIEELVDMKVKALQFLLVVDPAAFAPNNSLFGETVPFLIALLDEKSSDIDNHSRKTLKLLLASSGMFEGCTEQMDIWINSFTILEDPEERLEVSNWFVKIIQQAIKRTDKYLDMIGEAEEIAGEQVYSAERLEEIFNDLYERDSGISVSRIAKMLPWTSISPIFCSALENVKKNPREIIVKQLSHIAILTLHCQVAPGTLINLANRVENLPAKKYLTSWLDGETPSAIEKDFDSTSIVGKLSKILLSTGTLELDKVFEGETIVEFEHRGTKLKFTHGISEYEIGLLLRMTLFYLTQFTQKGTLSQEQFDKYELCVIALLNAAKNSRDAEDFTLIDECTSAIFMHPAILQYFSPICKSKNVVEKIVTNGLLNICQAAVNFNEGSKLDELFQPFKNKLIEQLRLAARKSKTGGKVKNTLSLMDFIEILRPSAKDVVDLLKTIMELPKENFLSDDKVSLSVWGTILPKLIDLLSRKNHQKPNHRDEISTMDASFVKKIVGYLTQLKTNRKVQLDSWEENLEKYLETYPHNIAAIDGRTFNSLLTQSRTSTSIKFLAFLVSRNTQYVPLFVQSITKNPKLLHRSDLVFPIIASNLSHPWKREFLSNIYAHYKQDVTRYFAEPGNEKNWVSANVEAAVYLIESSFEIEICEKSCATVLSNGDKLDSVDLSYVKLVESLFKKTSQLREDSEDPLTKLLQVLIRIAVSALKKDAKNEEKLRALCESLCRTINLLRSKNESFVFEDLSKNYSWPQFTRFSLKLGLKSSKDDKKNVPLLRALVSVCDVAYADSSEDEYVKTLFEMTTSHSEFVNLMLSSQSVKKDLLELLWILVRKNHSTMSSSQIPLYLAAYNATLSESDQLILMILQHYENHGIKFNEYRPYLWGEAAATYYSVKGEADTALWRQPSTSQVLDLFNPEIVERTITNYPVHRDLKPSGLCAAAEIYDPSFFLPLLTYLLSENNVVACHKVTQRGALALVFAACGSACEDTRLAAYVVIKQFYFHVEATSSKEKLLWIRIIDALRNGIIDTNTSLKEVRLSCMVSTFLARAALATTRPMGRLYSSIQAFFMAKPTMELDTIPELLNFFHNSEVEHLAHRHWILKVIRDGMKTDFDMKLALKCVIFKMLQGFYSSSLADPITKRLILEVIEATVKIPKAGLRLSLSYGLLPWLNETAANLDSRDTESVNLLVSIIRELLNSVLRTNDRAGHLQLLLLVVLKSLKPHLSKNVGVSCFHNYTSALSDILPTKPSFREALSRRDLEEIVELGRKILEDVSETADCLQFGSEFANKTRNDEPKDDEISIARSSLRGLVLTWCPTAR